VHVVVDGMNVIGARPDGWWRDRAAARRSLVGRLGALAEGPDSVTAVFDGRAAPGEVEAARTAGITVSFAPGGPNAADRAIVELVARSAASSAGVRDITVVTSDANLAQQVRGLGAHVEGAGAFRARLDSLMP